MKRLPPILLFTLLALMGFAQNYPGGQNIDRTWFKPGGDNQRKDPNITDNHRDGHDAVQAPGNDNCASATVLTLNGGCLAGQTTTGATIQGGECGFGGTCCSTWYRFSTGANTTLNLAWIYTNSPRCCPAIVILGPFAAGAGCIPCAPIFFSNSCQNADPGFHSQLTGLTTNSDYLIQVTQSANSGACGSVQGSDLDYCIGMYTVPSNDPVSGATNLNNCGVAFSGNNAGYSPDGTGTASSNLDANAATTCGTCAAGNDVPYVINNDQWFYFCTVNAGTYNITINNIANCVLSAPNSGIQCSILEGPTTAFTNLFNFPSPMAPGTSNTSSNFALAAGECIYMPIDGFAGDQCTYDFTLTNVSGGCIILPVELTKFDMKIGAREVDLFWETATEINNDAYFIQRSTDGTNYINIGYVKSVGNGNTDVPTRYDFIDKNPNRGMNYYRLTQIDKNGKTNELGNAIAKFYSDLSNYANIFLNSESSSLNVELSNGFPSGTFNVSLYNMLGEKVYSSTLVRGDNFQDNFNFDISSLKGGIYSCTIENGDNNTFVKKSFIKN